MKWNRRLWEEKKGERKVVYMRKYRAEHRETKEALMLKEQRYKQWAAEVGLRSSGEEPEDGPKKRTTKLEKAALGFWSYREIESHSELL